MSTLSADDAATFWREGFVVKRGFYSAAEMAALADALAHDAALHERAFGLADGLGGRTEIALWNEAGDDVFGALARGERLVGAAQTLLGDEVYHYHSKITMKRPGAGGTWVWHQDYGYWYKNGCLYPDMLSVAVPLSPMSTANGCLQVLAGSHRMGRLDHGFVGSQTGADPTRVAAICDRLATVAFEAEPGDVMLFHSNTLHTSSPNRSDHPRNLLLVAYNARANDPVLVHHHPNYTPLDVLPDAAILERAGVYEGEKRSFLNPADDRSIASFEPLG
jgi:ectoine hydroxylase